MLVAVRNNKPGITVYTDPETGEATKWQAKASPDGEDIQWLDERIANQAQMRKMISRGIFEVVPDEVASGNFEAQAATAAAREAQAAAVLDSTISHDANNDLVMVACTGPGTRPGAACVEQVAMRDIERKDRPPLCSNHEHLASQYVQVHGAEMGSDGKAVIKWVQVQMDPRATALT